MVSYDFDHSFPNCNQAVTSFCQSCSARSNFERVILLIASIFSPTCSNSCIERVFLVETKLVVSVSFLEKFQRCISSSIIICFYTGNYISFFRTRYIVIKIKVILRRRYTTFFLNTNLNLRTHPVCDNKTTLVQTCARRL